MEYFLKNAKILLPKLNKISHNFTKNQIEIMCKSPSLDYELYLKVLFDISYL